MANKVSVIIPVEPGRSVQPVLDRLARVRYPAEHVEVIVVEGRLPSHQRNHAVEQATGEIIYFLDSDSLATPELFEETLPHFSEAKVVIVGGPNVSPETDSVLQKAFDTVQTSLFGSYTIRARYRPVGVLRDTTEKELILCNMGMRKSVFMEMKGFDTRLYPNEENELMNRIHAAGYRLLYQPSAVVYRSRRDSIRAFMKQNFTYGRGRMEQMLVGFYPSDLVHLIPAGFVLYLALQGVIHAPWYDLPLWMYIAACSGFSLYDAMRVRRPLMVPFVAALYVVRHVAYGVGLWGGLVRKLAGATKPPITEPTLRWVKHFDQKWS